MIALKVRYKRPTPKMLGRAFLDASSPRGGPAYIESRASLKYRQREAERERQERQDKIRYEQELRCWKARQRADQNPWTHDSTVLSLSFIVIGILMFFFTLWLNLSLLAGLFTWLGLFMVSSLIIGCFISSKLDARIP